MRFPKHQPQTIDKAGANYFTVNNDIGHLSYESTLDVNQEQHNHSYDARLSFNQGSDYKIAEVTAARLQA